MAAAPTCLDDAGAAVEWWMLLKYPENHSPEREGSWGSAYAIATSAEPAFRPSNNSVRSNFSALFRTLAPLYSTGDGALGAAILYSDQPPNTTWYSATEGHSKGVLAASTVGSPGFFLQHSIPRFPAYPMTGYAYGNSQLKYGQHALCLSLD